MAPLGYIHDDSFSAVCNGTSADNRAACRYYQTGSCRRGTNCPFAHVSVIETPTLPLPAYQAEPMYTYHPVFPPLDSQPYPVFIWKPYAPFSPPFDPRYGFVRRAESLPDYPDDKSDPSSIESTSTLASMDYQHRAAWLGRAESRTPVDVGVSSSPGYAAYDYPVFPAVKAKQAVGRGRAASMVPLPLPSRQDDRVRKKPLAFKTKPCKFYAGNGKCASGDKCTFIHDPASRANTEGSRTKLAPPPDVKLPSKPLDRYDECRARDFYPITWRVIGGGVMMGGQRQQCPAFTAGHCKYGDDCRLAHETETDTDVGFIEVKSESDGSPRKSRSRPKAPPSQPHEGGNKGQNEVAVPSAPVHRRTRSMSMVLTSPPLQSNFAAEL